MQNENHQINQHDKGLCHVCGTKLENGVCTICGWTQMIFPSEVPSEIIEFNKQREKVAQKLHKEVCELKDTLKKLEKTSEEVSKYQQSLKKANAEAQTDRQEIDRLTSELKQANNKLSSAQVEKEKLLTKLNEFSESSKKNEELIKQIAQLESAAKIVEAQRKDLVERLNKTNDSLTKEIEDHKKTKALLEQQNTRIQMHTDDSSDKTRLQPLPCPMHGQQQGKPVATIIFSFRGQSVQENVFEGDNIYAIPSNLTSPVSGNAFRIESMNSNTFRLYDLCGLTRKVNGDRLGTTGMQLYNDDYFSVGDITIQIKMQKISLRDMLI
ncbi:hypothetical protein [Prevotella sp. tf2-5]|uniref:hypothetical protein n=1 Tax=Prevotella sp. tf2-5 TaxID=1761889 RepID=UPI0008ED13D5|nr:hypothetical protein [Prevotella sp. tf2-5]SFP14594.1 Tail length tape measure protein [Prevotella sp. tf2-5]